MDAVISFMNEFINAETDAIRTAYTHRGDSAVEAAIEKLQGFYASGVQPDFADPGPRSDQFFEDRKSDLHTVKPRVLFQIKRYKHRNFGDLYRCYTSNNITLGEGDEYYANQYVAQQGGRYEIIATYIVCMTCDSLGQVDGKKCPECKGRGWHHLAGERIKALGKPREIRKLQTPDLAAHLAEYEAE